MFNVGKEAVAGKRGRMVITCRRKSTPRHTNPAFPQLSQFFSLWELIEDVSTCLVRGQSEGKVVEDTLTCQEE